MTSKVDDLPKHVFVNCPFDGDDLPLFHAIVFTVVWCGFKPRCAQEIVDSGGTRIGRIAGIIRECGAGIHDISRTELDPHHHLPRFNMPLELGLFLGARFYGGAAHASKACLVLDREPSRYRKFISDIAGQDPEAHGDDIGRCIGAVRKFLNNLSGPHPLPGAPYLEEQYGAFRSDLPALCAAFRVDADGIEYGDFLHFAGVWSEEAG